MKKNMTTPFLIMALILLVVGSNAHAQKKRNVQVKVQYRKVTSFDFAGDKIDGKIKGAAVFYIFQRKRSKEHQVIQPPENFSWHKNINKQLTLKGID